MFISLAALWWAFRGLDWVAFKAALMVADLRLVAIGSLILIVSIPIRGYRWGILLSPIKRVSLIDSSEATLVGYFGNNALPFRLGELLRSYFLGKRTNSSVSQIFGTVIVERLLDSSSFVLLLLMLPLVGTLPEPLRQPVIWTVLVALAGFAMLIWLAWRKEIPFLKGRLKVWADNIKVGFASLREAAHYLPILIISVLIWLTYLASVHAAQLGIGLNLTWGQSYLILVTASLVIAVPSAPGVVGTYHAGIILLLVNVFGVEMSQAQAAAVVLHAVGFIPYTVLGAFYYFRSHIHIRDVRESQWDKERDPN